METTSSPILTPIRVIWVLTRGSLIDQILSILKSTQDQSDQGNKAKRGSCIFEICYLHFCFADMQMYIGLCRTQYLLTQLWYLGSKARLWQ